MRSIPGKRGAPRRYRRRQLVLVLGRRPDRDRRPLKLLRGLPEVLLFGLEVFLHGAADVLCAVLLVEPLRVEAVVARGGGGAREGHRSHVQTEAGKKNATL